MRRKHFTKIDFIFPIDLDNDDKPMLPSIQAPTFATPKDAYAYFTRHLKGQPYEADLSDDDVLPSDIFEAMEMESEDFIYSQSEREAAAEQSTGNATEKPSEEENEGALATEDDSE